MVFDFALQLKQLSYQL